jgi:hypothetical protein
MKRLLVHVEGQTEETFVNEVLSDHLYSRGYHDVRATIVGNPRRNRGGIRPWREVLSDLREHLLQDPSCIHTTMVDFYALPADWPGRELAARARPAEKAGLVEAALVSALRENLGKGFDERLFVPYVVMHEFEGLLFSDCAAFSKEIGRPELISAFQAIRDEFASPEEINDSPFTAPSKRIEVLVPRYQKPLYGNASLLAIGLPQIRSQCPGFDQWLQRLESVGSSI